LARSYFERSLAAFKELGHKWALAYSLEGLGRIAYEQGDYASARAFHEQSLTTRVDLGEKPGIGSSLAHLARSAYAQDQPERAVRLAATAEALFLATGVRMEPSVQALYDQDLPAARALLGEPEFTGAYEEGRAMTIEQATAYALAPSEDNTPISPFRNPQSASSRQAAKLQRGGLTAREYEVAILVAEGKSNREIADALVVSERTVEWHIRNIFSKLGLQSRSQLVAWALNQVPDHDSPWASLNPRQVK